MNATELEKNNRKQKLDNIINKITEAQLSKAANLAMDNAVDSDQDCSYTASDNASETDKAKSTEKIEKGVGGGQGGEPQGQGGAGTSSDLPAPAGHGADM